MLVPMLKGFGLLVEFLISNHSIFEYIGGTSKKEEVKRLPGGKIKKKVSNFV